MAPTPDQLMTSPDHYLYAFEGDAAVFVPMDRAAYQRSVFLDQRISPAGEGAMTVPMAVLEGPVAALPATGWIFHVAHCGSTLLARGLDLLAGPARLVLREPLALRQLGFAPDPVRLRLVLASLAKRYPGGDATLVKANVPVNFLLPEIAAHDPGAPAILLSLPLRDYLLAILRSDNHRAWLRGIVGHFGGALGLDLPCDDARAGAALWLGLMRRFTAARAVMPGARVLDAERLFAEPEATLTAAAAHFGIAAGPEAVAALVAGPLFATYSKRPDQPFTNAMRLARKAALADQLEADIAAAEAWITATAPDYPDLAALLARDHPAAL